MTLWQFLTVAAVALGLGILVVMAAIPFLADEPRCFRERRGRSAKGLDAGAGPSAG
jgi:hypothetical protein